MGSQSPSKGVVIPLDPVYNNVANGLNTLHSQLTKTKNSDQITVGPDHHLRKLFSFNNKIRIEVERGNSFSELHCPWLTDLM